VSLEISDWIAARRRDFRTVKVPDDVERKAERAVQHARKGGPRGKRLALLRSSLCGWTA